MSAAAAHAGLWRMGSGSSICASSCKVCADHCGGINWLSLSPDGRHLLTASEDCTARVWRTVDNQCCGVLQGHESYITFCYLENEAAFTCSADHTARKWDLTTGQCLAVYRGHTSIVNRILVAREYLFSGSYDRTARCWSIETDMPIQEFRGHRNCILALAHFSLQDVFNECEPEEQQDREFLVTGSTDCTVKVWDVSSGCCYRTLRGHSGAILCLVLDVPSKELFSGSMDYTIRRWNVVTGDQLKVFRGHQGSIICLEVVSQHLYSGSADRSVKRWITETGDCVQTYKTHKHNVSTLKYHAGFLFTGSGDACVRAFHTKSGILQRIFCGHTFIINCIQIHNELLYTASHDGTLRIWDIQDICKQKNSHRKDKSVQSKNSQKGSLSRLFHNKVGCSEQVSREQETVELT
ncbi:WD repeat-containing protein 86 [Microcaecilia unicolor]|uniref:WD repeat-containing protein 86 n=1 Tax=Microcaecilia unicolor TaxID=1415580 RepID=A0A6P7X6J1_9AMPH|nr:WD repeat-containing protein 86 [Microcaecilia unicolor]XP_030045770.1 WD repeat-containing protein 86 [Microcaecilia unicolor]